MSSSVLGERHGARPWSLVCLFNGWDGQTDGRRVPQSTSTQPCAVLPRDGSQNGLTENDGHEIGGQEFCISFENRLHYNAVCNSFQNNGRIQVTAAQ